MPIETRSKNAVPACVALVVLAVVGCQNAATDRTSDGSPGESTNRPRVAYVTNGVASFWVIADAGVEAGGREFDADVETIMPTGGASDQQRILQDLVSKNVDGIAVSPIDPDNQTGLINELSGYTKIITHDSDAPRSERLAYIGVDNYEAGLMCGRLVREALAAKRPGGGGKVAIFVGRLEQDNAKRRRQGTIDGLLQRDGDPDAMYPAGEVIEQDGYEIIGTYTDQFDRAVAKANAEDVLSRHPDIDVMVGLFAYNPPMILEALRQADRDGEVAVVAFDEDDATLEGIKSGVVHGTVVQNPFEYGRQSVRVLAGLVRGESLSELGIDESGIKHIPPRSITAANVDEFREEVRRNLGEEAAADAG